MKELVFSVIIHAPKEKVWVTLWDDETFRDWSSNIDEGTYILGDLVKGNEIQFISSINGYGVTSLVAELVPNQYILFKHALDTKETGSQVREKQWTGGSESYTLHEMNGLTTLNLRSEIPDELVDLFMIALPNALNRIKYLAEQI